MPSVSQKIRTGVVELRTHLGSVYVSPSLWERIYLLWTFRNFHSLPKQVLNRHQQQLIDKLCGAAIVSRNEPIARTAIIGAVENMRAPACKTEAAAAANKLLELSATNTDVAVSRALSYKGISLRSSREAPTRVAVGGFRRRSSGVQLVSSRKEDFAAQSETKEARLVSNADRTPNRNRLRWAFVAACGVALLGTLFYFRQPLPELPVTVPQIAVETKQPASGNIAFPALKPPASALPSRTPESHHRETVIPPQPLVPIMDSTPAERLQVQEEPESGFDYPLPPNPTLAGKVHLQAVIDTDGIVREVNVLDGSRALADAAVRAVRHWRYRPYKLNGHAVEVETNITISFFGDDAVSISSRPSH